MGNIYIQLLIFYNINIGDAQWDVKMLNYNIKTLYCFFFFFAVYGATAKTLFKNNFHRATLLGENF